MMKKILSFALIFGLLSFFVSSCSDDNDLPNVDYQIKVSGGVIDENTGEIYVVRGTTFTIDELTVTNVDSDKEAAITYAEYYWDYYFLGQSPLPPFTYNIAVTDEAKLGKHVLSIRTGIVAVDKEPAVGLITYTVVVVESEEDLPDNGSQTSVTTVKPGTKAL